MNEPSHALPMHFYRDPAAVVERNELDALGCSCCTKSHSLLGRVFCTEPKNERQKGVPRIGHHCKWFEVRS